MKGRASSFLRGTGSLAAAAAIVLGLSFAIVWPLWSLATGDRKAYTLAMGAVAALAALAATGRVLLARRRAAARVRARRPDA